VNGGQGRLNIDLNESIDSQLYSKWDFIELIVFNEDYKQGLHKYTWVISWISRYINKKEWQWISLKVEGIVSLLSLEGQSINKTYSWPLTTVINEFISDFHGYMNISNEMEYLWTNILKNGVADTSNVNVSVNWNYISALEKIFWENKKYFIDKTWTIRYIEEIQDEREVTMWNNISSIDIDTDGEIELSLSKAELDLQVWQKIFIENINISLNLENKRIQELAFWLGQIDISIWKIINYSDIF
jgi:hypothetical protein